MDIFRMPCHAKKFELQKVLHTYMQTNQPTKATIDGIIDCR